MNEQTQHNENMELYTDVQKSARSLAQRMPQLAAQWDYKKNAPLTPEQVTYGMRKKVWWRCAAGHSWQAQVMGRFQGNHCPICTNREIIVGLNDWASRFPNVAAQWDTEKNGCTPEQARSGGMKRYWWRCEKGHSWQALIRSRIGVKPTGCPYCTGQRVLPGDNDLQTLRPDIAAEWDMEKNAPLRPCNVTAGSTKLVYWRCKLGHSYLAEVSRRTGKNSGCPYCGNRRVLAGFNDLKTLCPEVAAEWHPVLNGDLKPADVMRGSTRRVWWQCAWGHEWQTVVYSRTGPQPTGCPYCLQRRKRVRN